MPSAAGCWPRSSTDMAQSKDVIAQHGLSESEYGRIQEHLGREPNLLELGIFSVLWS